jgi:hypothetical protein
MFGREYKLFMDFQAAGDTVWRKEKGVWSEMHKLGFPKKKSVELYRNLNNEIHAKVKIGKYSSYEFKVNKV